jgi:AcrR family transcriptional regulator
MPSSPRPKSTRTTPKGSRPGGRPTKEVTAQLSRDIQEAALALFLQHGYEGTSLDDIARKAGTTKASLYGRFAKKESLFSSVIEWAIGRSDWPEPNSKSKTLDLDGFDDLGGALRSVADAALRRATHPSMVRLTRITIAEVGRFPDLAQKTFAASWSHKQFVVDLLRHHAAAGAIVANEPKILAEHFLGLVAGMPAHLASFGVDRDDSTQRRYRNVAIELFLRGLRPD